MGNVASDEERVAGMPGISPATIQPTLEEDGTHRVDMDAFVREPTTVGGQAVNERNAILLTINIEISLLLTSLSDCSQISPSKLSGLVQSPKVTNNRVAIAMNFIANEMAHWMSTKLLSFCNNSHQP